LTEFIGEIVATNTHPLEVRIVHYEIADALEFARILGRPTERLKGGPFNADIALLRCMAKGNQMITVACSEGSLRQLLVNNEQSNRDTFAVSDDFPLRWRGWADPIETTESAA
jgi:hypothetical protein